MIHGKRGRLQQALLERLRTGLYPVGSRLPGLRVLANEFELHPNTVARVVTEMAQDGVLRTVQGSGTFVVAIPDAGPAAVDDLYASARTLALQARRLGLSRRDWARLTAEAESAAFGGEGPALWFVECSHRDAEELCASLSMLLERPVRPLLVDELPHHLMGRADAPGFYITTPFHVDEVETALADVAPVVTVNVVPTTATLVAFARFPTSARVAVVASNPQTLERFVRMLRTYTRLEPASAHLVDDGDAPSAAREADIVVDSHSIHARVAGWTPTGRVETVRYQIEPTSLAYLREVLRQREASADSPTSAVNRRPSVTT